MPLDLHYTAQSHSGASQRKELLLELTICSISFRNGVLDKVVAEVILNKTCQSSRLLPCLSGDFFSIFSAPAVYRFGYLEVFVLYVLINMSLVIMASKIIAELKDV